MFQEDLLERLILLDRDFHQLYPDITIECIIIGGSALILKGLLSRATDDIDIIYAEDKLLNICQAYGFSNNAATYESNLPYDYQDRLEEISIPTKSINYLTPSTEDIIVMKIYASREKDKEDIETIRLKGNYDKKLLDHCVKEAEKSSLSEYRYREMVSLYHDYFG